MSIRVSNNDLREFILAHLARHRIDMELLQLAVFNGKVQISGQIWHLAGRVITRKGIESLERDILATSGVSDVSFDFENLQRLPSGEWRLARKSQIVQREQAPADVRKPADVQEPAEVQKTADVQEKGAAPLVEPIPLQELLEVRPRAARSAA